MPPVKPTDSNSKRVSRRRFIIGAAAAVGGLTVYGAQDSNTLRVVRRTLLLPKWKADGFRVAQISDIHVNNSMLFERAQEAVRLAIDERPDLIVFTGDTLNEISPERLDYVHKVFALLDQASCPCFGVLGNHDYFRGQQDHILSAIHSTRLRILRNEIVDIDGIMLVGLDDAEFNHCKPEVIRPVRQHPSLLVLLHEPDWITTVPTGASLVLSGHSHGGEICLPGGHPLHTPRGAKNFWAGFYPHAHVPLFVNKGVATLGPFRTFCPPEITVLTLRQA